MLELLEPLDYPRRALANLGRGVGRLATGDVSADELFRLAPGVAGVLSSALLGLPAGALVGGALHGLGQMAAPETFDAPTPGDIVEGLGGDRESFLQSALAQVATDPLTYAGGMYGAKAVRGAMAEMPRPVEFPTGPRFYGVEMPPSPAQHQPARVGPPQAPEVGSAAYLDEAQRMIEADAAAQAAAEARAAEMAADDAAIAAWRRGMAERAFDARLEATPSLLEPRSRPSYEDFAASAAELGLSPADAAMRYNPRAATDTGELASLMSPYFPPQEGYLPPGSLYRELADEAHAAEMAQLARGEPLVGSYAAHQARVEAELPGLYGVYDDMRAMGDAPVAARAQLLQELARAEQDHMMSALANTPMGEAIAYDPARLERVGRMFDEADLIETLTRRDIGGPLAAGLDEAAAGNVNYGLGTAREDLADVLMHAAQRAGLEPPTSTGVGGTAFRLLSRATHAPPTNEVRALLRELEAAGLQQARDPLLDGYRALLQSDIGPHLAPAMEHTAGQMSVPGQEAANRVLRRFPPSLRPQVQQLLRDRAAPLSQLPAADLAPRAGEVADDTFPLLVEMLLRHVGG